MINVPRGYDLAGTANEKREIAFSGTGQGLDVELLICIKTPAGGLPRRDVAVNLMALLDIGGWAGAMLRLLIIDGLATVHEVQSIVAR